MSHFTVLVIGANPEQQLQPFHEYESTGIEDEFVKDIDITDEARAAFVEHGEADQPFEQFAEDWYGYEPRADGKVIKRTNPNSKWDWYQIGGRWSGLLKLKPGANGVVGERGLMGSHFAEGADRADQAIKGDVDFEGMRDEAGHERTVRRRLEPLVQ